MDDARQNSNEYSGYAYGPLKRTGSMRLRLDFNPVIKGDGNKHRIEGFNLRIMERPDDIAHPEQRAELGVSLTVEEWKALAAAMEVEVTLAEKWRDELNG